MKKTTKTLLMGLLLLLMNVPATAQVYSGGELHELYWTYRNRLKTMFVKVGTNPGESFPISELWNEMYFNDKCEWAKGRIGWGVDGISFHAYYMMMLATEFKLLKNAKQDTMPTLIELYYAIDAIDRIDRKSELFWELSESQNGFLARADVNANTYKNFEEVGVKMTDAANYQKFEKNGSGVCLEKDVYTEFGDTANIMSQDHITNMMVAFCFIKKFVGNGYVKPRSSDRGFNIHVEISAITTRIMNYISSTKEWTETELCMPSGTFTNQYRYKQNWRTVHPLTGNRVGQDKGGNYWFTSLALAEMAQKITGNGYWKTVDLFYEKDHLSPTCIGSGIAGMQFDLEDIVGPLYDDADNLMGTVDFFANIIFNEETINNNLTMFLPIFGVLDHMSQSEFIETADDHNYDLMKLIYYAYHDVVVDMHATEEMRWILNNLRLAPKTHNPIRTYSTSDFWRHTSGFEHSNRDPGQEYQGYFNGVDFMLAYNLSLLVNGISDTSLIDLLGYRNYSCDCSKDLNIGFTDIIAPYSTIYYKWWGQTVETTTQSSGTNEIRRFHADYIQKGLTTYRYFTKDNYVVTGSGKFQINAEGIVCNNKTLKVKDGGQIIIGKTAGDTAGLLIVRKGSKLILGQDGTGTLTINKNSRVIIEEGAELELVDNHYNIELLDPTSVLEIRGQIKLSASDLKMTAGSTGYFYFNHKKGGNNPDEYAITCFNGTEQILFTETGLYNKGAKPKHVQVNNILVPHPNIKLFKMDNVRMELEGNASIKIPCDFHFVNTDVTNISGGGYHNGVSILTVKKTQWITGNYFTKATRALHILKTNILFDVKIQYNDFFECSEGIQIQTAKAHIGGNKFTNCGDAVQASNLTNIIRMENNLISSTSGGPRGNYAINFYSATSAPVIVAGNIVKKTYSGLYNVGADVLLKCNYFEDIDFAVRAFHAGRINLSSTERSSMKVSSNYLTGGYNIIKFNYRGVEVVQNERYYGPYFNIDTGYNSYVKYTSNPYSPSVFIERKIQPSNVAQFRVYNSFWSPACNNIPGTPGVLETNRQWSGLNYVLGHFDIYDKVPNHTSIYGTALGTSINTCPISTWDNAVQNTFNQEAIFDLNAQHRMIPYILDGNIWSTSDFPNAAGISPPKSILDAIKGLVAWPPSGPVIPGNTGVLIGDDGSGMQLRVKVPAVVNLAHFLEDNWDQSYINRPTQFLHARATGLLLHTIATAIQDSVTTPSSGLDSMKAAALQLFNSMYAENQTHTGDSTYADIRYYIDKNKMVTNWLFRDYTAAKSIANTIQGYVQEKDVPEVMVWQCRIENDRLRTVSSPISLIEYESNILQCEMAFKQSQMEIANTISETTPEALGEGGSGILSITLSPNPANTTMNVGITQSSSASCSMYAINKFGQTVIPLVNLGTVSSGTSSFPINVSTLSNDVYTIVILRDGIPFSKHFIKN